MKKIIISESQLKRIIDNQIDEQATLTPSSQSNQKLTSVTTNTQSGKAYSKEFSQTKNMMNLLGGLAVNQQKTMQSLIQILSNARNVSWAGGIKKTLTSSESDIQSLAIAVTEWCTKNKYDVKLLKAAISILFRESKASSYSFYHPKELIGKLQNAVGMPDVKVFGKNIGGSNHSQGYAQIQPSTAKQYGIDMSTQGTFIGALDGAYKILSSNYQKALKFYKGPNITLFQGNKYLQVAGLDNDAALYMAVASHNAGVGIINKYCQTNAVGLANPCNVKDRKLNDQVLVTDPSKPINNYFPNVGGVHDYMPQFRKSFDALRNISGPLLNLVKA